MIWMWAHLWYFQRLICTPHLHTHQRLPIHGRGGMPLRCRPSFDAYCNKDIIFHIHTAKISFKGITRRCLPARYSPHITLGFVGPAFLQLIGVISSFTSADVWNAICLTWTCNYCNLIALCERGWVDNWNDCLVTNSPSVVLTAPCIFMGKSPSLLDPDELLSISTVSTKPPVW